MVTPKINELVDYLPCDDARERGIRSSDTQESAKVLYTIRGVGNVDGEANRRTEKASENERPTEFQLVRIVGKE